MKPSLAPGIAHELRFVVPAGKTVPHLHPEAPEFAAVPEVFATGFMVGPVEWACIRAIAPHLDTRASSRSARTSTASGSRRACPEGWKLSS